MSCTLFIYGFTAGSIIPLTIVYAMRPESLSNLWEFFSMSLFLTLNWSDGVAERFNLSTDLSSYRYDSTRKFYTCYSIESWYQGSSWMIYASFLLSILLAIVNQRRKYEPLLSSLDHQDQTAIDLVLYYFCIFVFAQSIVLFRLFIEYYYLGQFQTSTVIYLFWYIVSFSIVWFWNR